MDEKRCLTLAELVPNSGHVRIEKPLTNFLDFCVQKVPVHETEMLSACQAALLSLHIISGYPTSEEIGETGQ